MDVDSPCQHLLLRRCHAVVPLLKTEDTPCPQGDWKPLIEQHMAKKDEPNTMANSIQTAFYRRYAENNKFLVICAAGKQGALNNKIRLSSAGDGYCHVSNDNAWCQVVSLAA
ncbi:hypothetical protein Ddc_18046 [Ditylenchus destructor]|nr:hypothetical protein Ddc_18046 [Ditylenchus destructor]